MDFKIIETEPPVLLHRDRNDDGDETVVITAFVFDDNGPDYQLEESIKLPSESMVWSFISDYSQESAVQWLEEQMKRNGV